MTKYPQFNKQYPYLMEIFYGRTNVIDGGQTQGPHRSISNHRDQSGELCQSHKPFWIECPKILLTKVINLLGTKLSKFCYRYEVY